MKPLDPDKLAAAMIGGAKRYVDAALAPLIERLADAEKRATEAEAKIADMVAKAVAALPVTQDGRSVTVEELVPAIEERLSSMIPAAVKAIPVPKDGADGQNGAEGRGIAELLIDAKGHLVVTYTDGAVKDVGLITGKDGSPGKDGRDGAEGAPGPQGNEGAPGADGKSVDPEVVAELVRAEVEKAAPALVQKVVDAVPRPADGKDGAKGDPGPQGERGEPGPIGAKGADGISVTVEDVRPLVGDLVDSALKDATAIIHEAVKAIPVPKDGKDGRDGVDGQDGAPGEKGADGIDGRDGLDAVTPILKDGVLMFSMSDGTIKEIGHVAGTDGKDGAPGRDGVDGLGFDDLSVEYDGERGLNIRFEKGTAVREFPITLPIVIDRGVWLERGIEGGGYKTGDGVSWGGSFYIARKDTFAKPDDFEAWRLSVKRGRDAKEPGNLK